MARKKSNVRVIVPRRKAAREKSRVTAVGQALRALGGLGGSTLGSYLGNPLLGAAAGSQLGGMVSKWLGTGDYSITENSIVKAVQKGSDSVPFMHKANQSIVVRHKEFIGQVTGSTSFVVKHSLVLNPGLSSTFPWLAGLAGRFEQYRIRGLVFHYVPTSGSAVSSTNPALGSVMIQTNYRSARDTTTTAPATKQEMLNEYWSCEASPNEAFCHPIECNPAENPFQVHYVRTLPVPTDDSPLLYDYGTTFVATSGMPATNNVVGDLWATYEIELLKPLVASPVTTPFRSGWLQAMNPTTSLFFGNEITRSEGALSFSTYQNTITFPVGTVGSVVILVMARCTLSSGDQYITPTPTNCTLTPLFKGDLATYQSPTIESADGRILLNCRVIVTDPTLVSTIFMGTTAVLSALTYCGATATQWA